jgi:MFS family permease
MGAVYADSIGMSVAQISLFMGMAVVGGMILQWPIGALSDRYHRRSVLAAVVFFTAICALCAALLPAEARWLQLALVTLFGGLYLPTYSLCVAHTNDYLERDEIVAASGGLVLAFGAGACLGPLLCAGAMTWLDAAGFFWFLTVVHLLLGGFALLRIHSHGATPLAEQGSALPMPPSATTYTSVLAAEESPRDSGAADKAH